MLSLKNFVLSSFILGIMSFDVFAATVDFVVAEMQGNETYYDSYVLTLSNDSDIAHARDLINNGSSIGGALIVADIAIGSDGKNRNYLQPQEPLWSWHITSFSGFADFTAEILDGTPTYVENNLDWWMLNTGGTIGFWNYTIVSEIESSVVPLPSAMWLFLSGLLAVGTVNKKRKRKPSIL